jgi:hypothetical protein
MTKALAEISKLPERDQDALASWILDELKSEERWAKLFEKSQDLLGKMADEALKEHRKGKTRLLDPDEIGDPLPQIVSGNY